MKLETVEWQFDYELGVEDIDFQHHFFLNLINRIASQLQESDDLEYRTALIAELDAYARFHFISEENMMLRSGYPKLMEHKKLHYELIDQLSSKENMLAINSSEKTSQDIVSFLIDWFFHHTLTVDRMFSEYLHGKKST